MDIKRWALWSDRFSHSNVIAEGIGDIDKRDNLLKKRIAVDIELNYEKVNLIEEGLELIELLNELDFQRISEAHFIELNKISHRKYKKIEKHLESRQGVSLLVLLFIV